MLKLRDCLVVRNLITYLLHYSSPCIVGMLWTVTDTDTDLVTTEFLSQWIPSVAPTHWKYIDKMQWNSGESNLTIYLVNNV